MLSQKRRHETTKMKQQHEDNSVQERARRSEDDDGSWKRKMSTSFIQFPIHSHEDMLLFAQHMHIVCLL